jgi:hypothetical protein
MAASKSQKKRMDIALARKNKYKNLCISNGLGLEIIACGEYTTGGGAALESVSISGVLATDMCLVTLKDDGTNNATIVQAACGADKVDVTFSADPGADEVVTIMVIRSLASEDIY